MFRINRISIMIIFYPDHFGASLRSESVPIDRLITVRVVLTRFDQYILPNDLALFLKDLVAAELISEGGKDLVTI